MTSVTTRLNITDMRIQPPDMASQNAGYHDIHQQRPDSSSPQDTDVLDAMKDLDYEWNRPNSFYPQSYSADYARLSATHQPTQPTPISPWATYNHPRNTDQSPSSDTAMNFGDSVPSTLSSGFSGISSGSVTQTMSPSQIAFNYPTLQNTYSGEPVESRARAGTRGSGSSSYSSHFTSIGDEHQAKRRSIASVSFDSDSAISPTLSTRGRRSSCVEPGSARAVYLEKNRYAARKCRTKQKKHQEVLVEAARDMEQKNKQLKAEVEFLRSDMRDLMGLIFQHGSCPDQRLSRYVQREADRLGAQDSAKRLPKMESMASPAISSISSPETV